MAEQTPYSRILDDGIYEVAFPENPTMQDAAYRFVAWNDGAKHPIKRIAFASDTALEALYLPEQVYDDAPPLIRQWISMGKPVKRMVSPRNCSRHIKAEKPYRLDASSGNHVRHILKL